MGAGASAGPESSSRPGSAPGGAGSDAWFARAPDQDDASPDPAWARLERELAELIRELRGGDPETNARLRALIRK